MKRHLTYAMFFCATAALVNAQETKLKLSDVPPAVVAAASNRFQNAQISNWSKETEDGKTTFEAVVKDAAGKRDAVFLENGAFVATEEKILIAAIPPAVKTAIMNKYPSATLRAAEKISHESGDPDYEVHLGNAAHKEVTVTSSGKILKEE